MQTVKYQKCACRLLVAAFKCEDFLVFLLCDYKISMNSFGLLAQQNSAFARPHGFWELVMDIFHNSLPLYKRHD